MFAHSWDTVGDRAPITFGLLLRRVRVALGSVCNRTEITFESLWLHLGTVRDHLNITLGWLVFELGNAVASVWHHLGPWGQSS